jgi:type I restriction enzyme S subunit
MSESVRTAWGKVKLSEVCTITRGSSPRPIIDWVSNTGTPWVKISDATSQPGRYISATKECIKNEARSKSVVVLPGDLIVSNSATPGLPKFMKIEACIHDGWLLFRNFNGVLPEFLYYVILNDRKQLVAKGNGSVFTNLKTEILKNHEVSLPSIREQRQIAQVLSCIDDLIQKNTELKVALEEFAQTVFKSWFIDFDPVKAKMTGEKPVGMDDSTATLFPDSMEDSELGPIPKGWRIGSMAELFGLQGGFSFKSSSWQETGVPVVKIGSVKPGLVDLSQVSYIDPSLAQTTSDIYRLPRGSLVVGLTGYVGEVGLLMQHSDTPLLNQRVAKFLPVSGHWKIPFIYCLTRRPQFKQRVIEAANGSAQQNVSNSQILGLQTCVPTFELVGAFESRFESLFDEILLIAEQNLELSQLRDSLLPRLISGEIRVPEELMMAS